MEPFIGQVMLFAGNFAPRGWAFCNGQLLSIAQNTALFSILGTTYGGNGQTTFGLPDLRGRVPIHSGNSQGPGLSPYVPGQQGGNETVTLLSNQMPMHNHLLSTNNTGATQSTPSGAYPAKAVNAGTGDEYTIYNTATDGTTLNPQAIGMSGGNQPHNNIQPYLGINYIIALEGIFPSRN